jgi:hypothetical protein
LFLGRVADKKHAHSLKRLNMTTKQNRVNTAIQIRKQKLIKNKEARQTIGAIDGVTQIIVIILNKLYITSDYSNSFLSLIENIKSFSCITIHYEIC